MTAPRHTTRPGLLARTLANMVLVAQDMAATFGEIEDWLHGDRAVRTGGRARAYGELKPHEKNDAKLAERVFGGVPGALAGLKMGAMMGGLPGAVLMGLAGYARGTLTVAALNRGQRALLRQVADAMESMRPGSVPREMRDFLGIGRPDAPPAKRRAPRPLG